MDGPVDRALDRLWARGVTVVVASGNDGANEVNSPATDPSAAGRGAQDEADTAVLDDDTVPDFSSYGRAFGQKRPDLVAPGVSLISTSRRPARPTWITRPHRWGGLLKGPAPRCPRP